MAERLRDSTVFVVVGRGGMARSPKMVWHEELSGKTMRPFFDDVMGGLFKQARKSIVSSAQNRIKVEPIQRGEKLDVKGTA